MNLRAIALVLAAAPALAFGHAVVQPAESGVGETQQYTLRVPNEKDVPTVAVSLRFPAEIDVAHVDEQTGWHLALQRDSNGRIVSATWTGSLPPKADARFTFSAHNPATPVTVSWNVIQTYVGALEVEWTGPVGSRTPASRTSIH
jgi:YD repeat-containing protein